MTKTLEKTIKYVTFDLLNDEQKETFLKNISDEYLLDDQWFDFILNDFKENNSDFFDIENIYFELHDRNQGVYFDNNTDINISNFIEKHKNKLPNLYRATNKNDNDKNPCTYFDVEYTKITDCPISNYTDATHEFIEITLNVEFEKDYYGHESTSVNQEIDLLEKIINQHYIKICKKLYADLNNQYYYLTSEESIIEYLLENDTLINAEDLTLY